MAKTKKQLRAEAVERLRKLEGKAASYADYCKAIVDCPDGFLGQVAVTEIIDLLTDDDSTTESLSDEADSRERLEADIIDRSEQCRTILGNLRDGLNTVTVSVDVVRGWLDRQAAITERECWHNCCQNHVDYDEEYKPAIDELTAERDEIRDKFGKALDLAHEIVRLAE